MQGLTRVFAAAVTIAITGAAPASAQQQLGTAFTYQGELSLDGAVVDQTADFRVSLWNAAVNGDSFGPEVEYPDVQVEDGLFTLDLDFDNEAFDGDARWLQIEVRTPAGTGQFTTLSPRQPVRATPYALQTRGMFINDDTNSVSFDQHHAIVGTSPLWNPSGWSRVLNLQAIDGTFGRMAGVTFSDAATNSGWTVGYHVPSGKLRFSPHGSTSVVTVPVLEIRGGGDIAEPFNVRACSELPPADKTVVKPGMLVAIDPENPGEMVISTSAYDTAIAGVISGANGVNPGMVLYQEASVANGEHPVALTGRVWAYCDADANGPIKPGDLLTSADLPGHAMKVSDRERAQGAIIGKAMSSLESGQGLVFVLVTLQ